MSRLSEVFQNGLEGLGSGAVVPPHGSIGSFFLENFRTSEICILVTFAGRMTQQ